MDTVEVHHAADVIIWPAAVYQAHRRKRAKRRRGHELLGQHICWGEALHEGYHTPGAVLSSLFHQLFDLAERGRGWLLHEQADTPPEHLQADGVVHLRWAAYAATVDRHGIQHGLDIGESLRPIATRRTLGFW